ncbi:SDR family NAD(P)-dependent oxidoreductase [Streptomyces sp. I05A-00742]|uniref:SDR family NAD(P)-dependent oxidoreductase n=1 Tax=Streptomyces sp. I05A-00742 TaxID=2732853 RepID=UPI001489ACD6|nr:SDR family oxidoreductase [Streptomyces sp. I05A-00742]
MPQEPSQGAPGAPPAAPSALSDTSALPDAPGGWTSPSGPVVVVTGAGTGIGRATAHAFADAGARVLAVGRQRDRLEATAADRPDIHPCVADLTAPDAPDAVAAAALDRFGAIDVLVNNAALVVRAPLGRIDEEQARRQIETNLLAPLRLTQSCLEPLRRARGTVVNVSTAGAVRGWPANSVYGATKAGLDFLTRTWAVELAADGVRVVGVAPGPVDTEIAENSGLSADRIAELRAAQRARVPLGRIGRPEEIAWWIVALSRPEAGFTTGAVLPVDGAAAVAF